MKKIEIQVMRVDDLSKPEDGIVWPGVYVFGFNTKSKKDKFEDNRAKKRPLDISSESDEYAETDEDGFCTIKLSIDKGYFIIYPFEEGEQTEYKVVKVGSKTKHKVPMKVGRTLKGATKYGKGKEKTVIVPPSMCGKTIPISIKYLLDPNDVNVKDRILVSPLVTIIETGDTLGRLSPFVMNGEEFLKANYRKLGYDFSRDPFYSSYKGEDKEELNERTIMRNSYEKDYMYMDFALTPINRNLHYMVTADRYWIRNFSEPYRQDSICLHEGPVLEPMRFLDYDVIEEPLQRGKNGIYYRNVTTETLQNREKLFLNFLQGEAILDPNDSTNFKQLRKMTETMSVYDTDDSGIQRLDIHGCASPEGGYELNNRLSKERANYLKERLRNQSALYIAYATDSVFVTSKVATWKDVGDLLYQDSLKSEANLVYDIVEQTNNLHQQELLIRKLPFWTYINESILPRLRYVDVQYSCYANREKTREEIWTQYQNDPDYRNGKKVQFAYEFYELFDLIKKQEEKEVIAQVAYERIKERQRPFPWALAACELARSKLVRGKIDSTLLIMLRPYINFKFPKLTEVYNDAAKPTKDYYNDPAIVTTYINILCKDGDFAEAYKVAEKCLPNQPRYNMLRTFLKCLNCQWDDPGVRDTVINSSYWNRIVILAASETEIEWRQALDMLYVSDEVNQADPRALYMKAQLLFKLFGDKNVRTGKKYTDANFIYDNGREFGGVDQYSQDEYTAFKDIGIPLVQCCLIDSTYLNVIRWDGVFSTVGVDLEIDYRKAFYSFWDKLKAGKVPKPILPEPTAQHKEASVTTETKTEDSLDELMGIDE